MVNFNQKAFLHEFFAVGLGAAIALGFWALGIHLSFLSFFLPLYSLTFGMAVASVVDYLYGSNHTTSNAYSWRFVAALIVILVSFATSKIVGRSLGPLTHQTVAGIGLLFTWMGLLTVISAGRSLFYLVIFIMYGEYPNF